MKTRRRLHETNVTTAVLIVNSTCT